MTTARKKTRRKSVRKAGSGKKKARKSAKAGKSRSKSPAKEGGFVILLDEPDESEEEPKPQAVVRLRSDCTIEEISGIHQRLLAAFKGSDALCVDLGAVEGVDTAFLQLLCVLAREADAKGVALAWQNHPESFVKSAALLGIEGRFPRA